MDDFYESHEVKGGGGDGAFSSKFSPEINKYSLLYHAVYTLKLHGWGFKSIYIQQLYLYMHTPIYTYIHTGNKICRVELNYQRYGLSPESQYKNLYF